MDTHRIHSISNYLLGEDLLLEISLPELQTMIKQFCPTFPDQVLKGLTDSEAKVQLMNMGNSVRAILDPGKAPVNSYNTALPILRKYTKGGKVVPYPFPKTAAELDAPKASVKSNSQSDSQRDVLKNLIRNEFCPDMPEDVLNSITTWEAAKAELVKMATKVYQSKLNPDFPVAPARAEDAIRFLKKHVSENGVVPYPYPEKASMSGVEKTLVGPSDLVPFPGNNELLVKYYNHTVDLGWPGKKVEMDGKKIKAQPDSPSYIPFSLYYKGKVDKEDGEVKPYNMPRLVQKAKDLVDAAFKKHGIKKIKQLRSAIENIIEADKKYKMSHKVHFKDKFAKFVSGMVRVLGGNEADDKVINWLARRSETMTVFEFQKLIIDEVYTKNTVTDETALKIAEITKLIRDRLNNKNFIVSGNKGSSWNPGEVYFEISNARKISPITVEHSAKPMLYFLEALKAMVGDAEIKKAFTDLPTLEEINAEIGKVKDWVANPKDDKKTYEYGSEQNSLTCVKDMGADQLEVRPVFNDRAGVAVYTIYTKDSE